MQSRGIDISHWQGNINFNLLKSEIDFMIIKAGGSDKTFYKDKMFETYYKEAKAHNIPVGAYYFVGSKCISYADGVADAKRFIELLKGKQFEYPVYIDIETTNPAQKAGATDAVVGFCETMESAGYYVGIYASDISGFKERLNIDNLRLFDKWVARYGTSPKYVNYYGMWQYSSTGRVKGISGNVDLDIAYINYPMVIKSKHLNGF